VKPLAELVRGCDAETLRRLGGAVITASVLFFTRPRDTRSPRRADTFGVTVKVVGQPPGSLTDGTLGDPYFSRGAWRTTDASIQDVRRDGRFL